MKKIKCLLPLVVLSLLVISCEEGLKTWSGVDRMNFVTSSETDTLRNYSFVFQKEDVMTDTVWLEVIIQGMITDYPRTVKFRAIEPYDGDQAIPGKHYVDFESVTIDEELKAKYVIPAGKNKALIPVVLIRDESLKTGSVQLRIVFDNGNNEYFQNGFSGIWAHRTIIFTDVLSKPQLWDDAMTYDFGTYGPVKHRFMIATSGQSFNDDWIMEHFVLMSYPGYGSWWEAKDRDYIPYLAAWLRRKLAEENERRKEANDGVDDPLVEDNGTRVVI